MPDKDLEMELPAHRYLVARGITHQRLTFSPQTERGAGNVADALGFAPEQMVKTLIFEAQNPKTETSEWVLVMLSANQSAVSGRLKKAVGSRNVRLAPPERVREITGYEIGSIPPFHWQAEGFRTFVDAPLMEEKILGVGAGVWGQEIMIAPLDLVTVSGAIVVDLSGKAGG